MLQWWSVKCLMYFPLFHANKYDFFSIIRHLNINVKTFTTIAKYITKLLHLGKLENINSK